MPSPRRYSAPLVRGYPIRILTIAGFDPSAGAGILADIKTFEYFNVYGQAVCTAVTIQNENEFVKPNYLPWMQIKEQLEILAKPQFEKICRKSSKQNDLAKIPSHFGSQDYFSHIKIGLVENPQVLEKIFKFLRKKYPAAFIIWDPILKASTGNKKTKGNGFQFHKQNAVSWQKLFTYADLITPNLPEAEFLEIEKWLTRRSVNSTSKTALSKPAILIKGGHSPALLNRNCEPPLTSNRELLHGTNFACRKIIQKKHSVKFCTDTLYLPSGKVHEFHSKRVPNASIHGSGCKLSAAILANLALGNSLETSCQKAKKYISKLFSEIQ